jgi:GTPase-activating protein BEM2
MFPDPVNVKLMNAASKFVASVLVYCYLLYCKDQNDVDLDTKLISMRQVVHDLPRTHFDLLKRLIEHLDK